MEHPNQYRYFIGVDISKATATADRLDFAVFEANQVLFHVEVSNDEKGIQDFFRQLKALDQGDIKHSLFCLEHTGIYNNPLLSFLFQKKAAIWPGRRAVEKATQIRESIRVSRTKNDKVDAIKIARYAYKNRPGRRAEDAQLWHPKHKVIEQLDRLTAMREGLVSAIHMLKVPLNESIDFVTKK